MSDREQQETDEKPLEGDLHHLRTILDQRVPRVTNIPALAGAAREMFASLEGLEAILAVLQLAIDRLPDERGTVAERLYGLTRESKGQKVKGRRETAIVAYEGIIGEGVDYESFRTNAERDLIQDLAIVLLRLIDESRADSTETDRQKAAHTAESGASGISSSTTRTIPNRSLPPPDDLADEVAQQTFSLVDNLVSPGLRLLSSDFDSTCDWLYDELMGHLVDVLGSLIVNCFREASGSQSRLEPRREGANATRVLTDDGTLVIAVAPRLSRPSEVDVQIAPPDEAGLPPNTQIPLSNDGRFVLASLALSPELASAEPWVATAIRGVLDSGDRAIETFVVNQLAFDVTGAVAQLYGLVRRYFPRQVAETIRIFLLDPSSGGGMHLDHAAQQTTLNSLRPDYGVEGVGSAEKLLRLAVARFPVTDSVAAEIVPSMQTVVRSPLLIPSARKVGAIQHELFGPTLVLQPLLNSDRLWVEAGYPAALRSVIEPVLEQHRAVIIERARALDFAPALQQPAGEPFDLTAARSRRREQFRTQFGHLIAGYPAGPP